MYVGQLSVTVPMVRALVDDQFPQWRSLPVWAVSGSGTVNAVFRISDRFVARFPLRGDAPAIVLKRLEAEASAAAKLYGRSGFRTPGPVVIGRPVRGYGLPWSVQTWVPGTVAIGRDPAGSMEFARDLAQFTSSVRATPTEGARFTGSRRGGILRSHDAWMQICLDRSERLLDVKPLRSMWSAMRQLPRGPSPDVMNHGDLMPGNIVVSRNRRLAGVIDVGDLGPADPALDLVAAWHLLDTQPRTVFRDCLQVDDLQWARGKAWAFQQAMGLIWYYAHSNPAMSRTGRRTLSRLHTDWSDSP